MNVSILNHHAATIRIIIRDLPTFPAHPKDVKDTGIGGLSGDVAFALYQSILPDPIAALLWGYKTGEIKGHPKYIHSIVGAYDDMMRKGLDGRYGKIRRE